MRSTLTHATCKNMTHTLGDVHLQHCVYWIPWVSIWWC